MKLDCLFLFFLFTIAVQWKGWNGTELAVLGYFPPIFTELEEPVFLTFKLKITETSPGCVQVFDTVEIHHHWLVPLELSDNFGNEFLLDCSFISLSLFKHSLHHCSHLAIATLWKCASRELWSIPILPFMARKRSPKISFCYRRRLFGKCLELH